MTSSLVIPPREPSGRPRLKVVPFVWIFNGIGEDEVDVEVLRKNRRSESDREEARRRSRCAQ